MCWAQIALLIKVFVMKEIWKDVVWYEWSYQVSNLGRVKWLDRICWNWRRNHFHKWIILKWWISCWYHTVALCLKHKVSQKKVSRLVALTWIPNPENKRCVNHLDWNRLNDNIKNLEWCTHSENNKHAYEKLWHKITKHWLWKFWIEHHSSKAYRNK